MQMHVDMVVMTDNVVFPGGHAELGESDLQACKRELMEEISLDTDHECLYVGQIPKNFYYAKKRGKIVYISCHVWILKP
jgi:8-oxo-dGTP pyrophosphatase MutT (NUDIX family)